jgi:hypothetical protein
LNQTIREKDEQMIALMQDLEWGKNDQKMISKWQEMDKKSKEIVQGI